MTHLNQKLLQRTPKNNGGEMAMAMGKRDFMRKAKCLCVVLQALPMNPTK